MLFEDTMAVYSEYRTSVHSMDKLQSCWLLKHAEPVVITDFKG
jgi:hypothetical protein